MQEKSWAQPYLGWALSVFPQFRSQFCYEWAPGCRALWKAHVTHRCKHSPHDCIFVSTCLLFTRETDKMVGNILQRKILNSVGETHTWAGRIFHLPISAVAVLLCKSKTGRWFMQTMCATLILCSALEYTLLMALWHSGNYKGTQIMTVIKNTYF